MIEKKVTTQEVVVTNYTYDGREFYDLEDVLDVKYRNELEVLYSELYYIVLDHDKASEIKTEINKAIFENAEKFQEIIKNIVDDKAAVK